VALQAMASPLCPRHRLAWATPHAVPRPVLIGPGRSAVSSSARRLRQPQSPCVLAVPSSVRSLRTVLAASREPIAGGQDHEAELLGSGASSHSAEDSPWTFQQLVSVLSGLLGSLLSATAFSRQREASRARRSADKGGSDAAAKSGARIVQQLGGSLLDAEAESPLFSLGPIPPCTRASSLREPGRHFTIITTAALPWLTGTAVNPLLRALNLARSRRPVLFVIPWLELEDQKHVFPNGQTFLDRQTQEEAIFKWCRERAKIDPAHLPFQLRWYSAKWVKKLQSIFPTGDCSDELGTDDPRDVLILEEPEHLCWYHHGQRWPLLFRHVIGVVHTNYQDYMSKHKDLDVPEELMEASVFAASTMVCSAYCDVNIKLSDTIMPLPNEVTCNVHGVREDFLRIGDSRVQQDVADAAAEPGTVSAYYLGKAVFEKGWGELLDLLEAAGPELSGVKIDGFGSGFDYDSIAARGELVSQQGARLEMHPGIDHANEAIHGYGVLVNPSTSDVLCTVTVEALAMGKHCVLARHPSNRFFEEYFPSRCHFFRVGETASFVAAVRAAVAAGPPRPLPPEVRRVLTWEAATERLFEAAEVRVLSGPFQRPSEAAASRLAYRLHYDLQEDTPLLADLIKEATLGEATPWAEYLAEWRITNLGELRRQAQELKPPEHIQEHERYLRDRVEELSSIFTRSKH